MTDQELLERAARAAGYEPCRMSDDETALLLFGVQEPWNPLDDDGDAFRLAVELQIQNYNDGYCGCAKRVLLDQQWIMEPNTANKGSLAATRRAIVRAAAAMAEDV